MVQRLMTEDAKVDENVAEAYKYAFRNPGTVILYKFRILHETWRNFFLIV